MAGWDGVVTGINQTDNNSESLLIYPNPAKDKITIQTKESNGHYYFTLSDIGGKELIKQLVSNNPTEIDIRNLSKGVYILKLIDKEKVEVRKIIIE
jgi:hypothetical protein